MRLFNFEKDGRRGLGASVAGALLEVTNLGGSRVERILDYVRLDEAFRRDFNAEVQGRASALPRLDEDAIRFLSVVEPGSKFMCIGLNYLDHCREQGVPPPDSPVMFAKMENALAGHREEIPVPVTSTQIDFEVELAVMIGRVCRRVSSQEAMGCVAGFTIVNDVTARDHQKTDGQWVRAKSLDKFGPNGPYLVTADEVPDPRRLGLRLDLNGRRMQDSNTSNLIFDVPYLVHFYSQDMTLRPGDLISTGTPPGVGAHRKPPAWVQPGDVMQASVEGLGVLMNRLSRESPV
jgi:2-keto-4-pentenoate hydratase/2-oxohepta-3-ene-1,7-dioic acid hydratase in catechol pathway